MKDDKKIENHTHCLNCGEVLEIIKEAYGGRYDGIFFTVYFCGNNSCGKLYTRNIDLGGLLIELAPITK